MAIPRAKKKKVKKPTENEQKWVIEANYMTLAIAVEQLWTDYGWRVKRINNLIRKFWREVTECQRAQREDGVVKATYWVAKQAEEILDEPIVKKCEKLGLYKGEAYMLTIGCLVKALRKLKVNKIRCKLILGAIFYEQKNFAPWSVYKECKDITGFDVKVFVEW